MVMLASESVVGSAYVLYLSHRLGRVQLTYTSDFYL